jgi:hypothetical protein
MASIVRLIIPGLFADTVLTILIPIAFIYSAVVMFIYPIATSPILYELSCVLISIGMLEVTPAVGLPILKVAFINSAIFPYLYSKTVFLAVNIYAVIFEFLTVIKICFRFFNYNTSYLFPLTSYLYCCSFLEQLRSLVFSILLINKYLFMF